MAFKFTPAKTLHDMYEEKWCPQYTTDKNLNQLMTNRAKAGDYEFFVYVESKTVYDDLFARLKEAGYSAEHYNGGGSSIIEIHFSGH